MKKFPKFDYCIIYIAEAHPFDGWKIDNPEQPKVNQPKARVPRTTLPVQDRDEKLQDGRNRTWVVWFVDPGQTMEDRVDNANVLFDKINFPVNFFIDTMTNQACNAFGALPERLAVILDEKIEFLGGTGPTGYSIPELENHLMKY